MPSHYTGTKDERLDRLAKRGQRCDGQLRNCTQTAVVEFTLLPVSPADGQARPGAEAEIRKACSKHRRQYGDNANYKILHERVIPKREVSRGEVRRGTERQIRMRALVGCTFISEPGAPLRRIEKVRYDVDDVRVTTEKGEAFMLRDLHQVNLAADHDEATLTSADEDGDSAESARQVAVPLAVRFSG